MLYSGVAGLKTHQTKMDVIGNNIANVNTTAYKAQSITFNELMYQTTKRASGASATTGVGGTNAGQIGLGVKVGAINTNISSQGATQTTNLPFDLSITGDSFFIVNNGQENFFTRAGSFYVDGAGNLAMTSTGYNVMGWVTDPTTGDIKQDTVVPLQVMHPDFMNYEAEATTMATVTGITDKNDTDIRSSSGKIINLEFYDTLGYSYTARMSAHVIDGDAGQFYVQLDDILDKAGESIGAAKLQQITFGSTQTVKSDNAYLLNNNISATDISLSDGGTNTIDAEVGASYVIGTTNGAPSVAALEAIYGTGVAAAGDTVSIDAGGNLSVTKAGETTPVITRLPAGSEITSLTMNNTGATKLSTASEYIYDDSVTPPVFKNTAGDTLDMATLTELYGMPAETLESARAFTVDGSGMMTITQKEITNAALLDYIPGTGQFARIAGNTMGEITLGFGTGPEDLSSFRNIAINFGSTLMNNKDGKSTLGAERGGSGENAGLGTGRKIGEMTEVIVQDDGKIYANYDNGQSRLLGQIATASFANPSGLEKRGDNLYSASMNSGEFDGIGSDIKEGGGYMTSGVLEMSNVDLSSEFTEMITTQRGFQANSRIITVSDTLLEELTNLKR